MYKAVSLLAALSPLASAAAVPLSNAALPHKLQLRQTSVTPINGTLGNVTIYATVSHPFFFFTSYLPWASEGRHLALDQDQPFGL